jgi:hypothetical protein
MSKSRRHDILKTALYTQPDMLMMLQSILQVSFWL